MELNRVQEHTHPVSESETEAEMEHSTHRAGTVRGCTDCNSATYEPSWYATLLAASQERELLVNLREEAQPAFS
jgi:hypothetical protein